MLYQDVMKRDSSSRSRSIRQSVPGILSRSRHRRGVAARRDCAACGKPPSEIEAAVAGYETTVDRGIGGERQPT